MPPVFIQPLFITFNWHIIFSVVQPLDSCMFPFVPSGVSPNLIGREQWQFSRVNPYGVVVERQNFWPTVGQKYLVLPQYKADACMHCATLSYPKFHHFLRNEWVSYVRSQFCAMALSGSCKPGFLWISNYTCRIRDGFRSSLLPMSSTLFDGVTHMVSLSFPDVFTIFFCLSLFHRCLRLRENPGYNPYIEYRRLGTSHLNVRCT